MNYIIVAIFVMCSIVGTAFQYLDVGLAAQDAKKTPSTQRIVVGSCLDQNKPQPCWRTIMKFQPDLLILCGDNIYGDSRDVEKLKRDWEILDSNPDFSKLRKSTQLLATWDDHDYGENDAGRDFPIKKQSQKLFLDWLQEPEDSARRSREGVYAVTTHGPSGRRVQVILLDTRYHRSELTEMKLERSEVPGWNGPYVPSSDRDQQMLGEEQWKWLATVLKEPADLRLLVSGIQLIPEEHSWEAWLTRPLERERLISLLRTTNAGGVIVISGDRHAAEISKLPQRDSGISYPIYELTASSLNASFNIGDEPNRYREGKKLGCVNFGTVDIDWNSGIDAEIQLAIHNAESGEKLQEVNFPLSSIQN